MSFTEPTKKSVRVVVADDNKQLRDMVVELLRPDYDVVGSAADGKGALEIIKSLKPDIAVLDISMPILTGIEVAAELKKTGSPAKVVFLTVHKDSDYVTAALNVGACGYVVKSQMADDLAAALSEARGGGVFISPEYDAMEESKLGH